MTWRSKKQSVVARSSVEVEYKSMAHGICEALWLRTLLHEVGFKVQTLMSLYCDNKSTISISYNPMQHDRTKYIEVDRYFIRENILCKLICTPFVTMEQQLADVLTKGVTQMQLHDIISKLGMVDIHTLT